MCVRFTNTSDVNPQAARHAIDQIESAIRIAPERYQRIVSTLVTKRASSSVTPSETIRSAPAVSSPTQALPSGIVTSAVNENGNNWKRWAVVAGILAAIVAVIYFADYLYDLDQHIYGYAAYQRADCHTALSYMNRVSTASLFGGIGSVSNIVQTNATDVAEQCKTLAAAQVALAAGDPASALGRLLSIERASIPSFLISEADKLVQSLVLTTLPSALATYETCQQVDEIGVTAFFESNPNAIPEFLFGCGRAYDSNNHQSQAFDTYVGALADYPDSAVAVQIEQILLESNLSCGRSEILIGNDVIAARESFMGKLYLACGKTYEDAKDYENALRVYREFMGRFEEHPQLEDVRDGLARSLFQYALSLGAPEIPEPGRSGSTKSGQTVVVIQNDSPESMRISFSGPDTLIEDLGSCIGCRVFRMVDEPYCQELGPVGTYTLAPGTYNVVVEATSDDDVIPFVGTWVLEDGAEYSHCFYITRGPVNAGATP